MVNSLALGQDGPLAFCIAGGDRVRVGFVNSESEEFGDETIIELAPLTNLAGRNSLCKVSIVEDHAYAFYFPSSSSLIESAPMIVKMSLQNRTVAAIWEVPEAYFPEIWLVTDEASQGIEASLTPGQGYFMTTRRHGDIPGILAVTVDLQTGVFTEEVVVPLDDVKFFRAFSILEGRYLFGFFKQRSETTSQQFMIDLVTKEMQWENYTKTPDGLTINRETKQMLITQVPSGGWHIFDYLTGELVKSYDYITGGFFPTVYGFRTEKSLIGSAVVAATEH